MYSLLASASPVTVPAVIHSSRTAQLGIDPRARCDQVAGFLDGSIRAVKTVQDSSPGSATHSLRQIGSNSFAGSPGFCS